MTYDEYVVEQFNAMTLAIRKREKQYGDEERLGQRIMNALYDTRPDLYAKLINEPNRPDPFYDDEKVVEFWAWFNNVVQEEEKEQLDRQVKQ